MNESLVTTSSPASQAPTIADSKLKHQVYHINAPDASKRAKRCALERALQVVSLPGHEDHKASWYCAEFGYARMIGPFEVNISLGLHGMRSIFTADHKLHTLQHLTPVVSGSVTAMP